MYVGKGCQDSEGNKIETIKIPLTEFEKFVVTEVVFLLIDGEILVPVD